MAPSTRDELAGRFGQLFGGISLELYHLLQKEIEPHEPEIVEKVMHGMRRDSEKFSFSRLRELLQYESGRKNDVARVTERRAQLKSERTVADASFKKANEAVDALSHEDLVELFQRKLDQCPGLQSFFADRDLRKSKMAIAIVEEQ